MIPKTKHFDWIEDYCLGQLTKTQKQEFEAELGRNSELREALQFEKDLHSAVTEKDVLKLREKLDAVANRKDEKADSFKMLEGLAEIQELTDTVAPEDLLDFYDSLPKVHVYQHELVSNENIHQYYKEQSHYLSEMGESEGSLEDINLDDVEGLDEAILEKDIFDLRNTLRQVAKSVQPQFSVEEVDEYINGNLKGQELELFEEELDKNHALQLEVSLHKEIEYAINEHDVRDLRNDLKHIMETETSWNVSEESIEMFIDSELEDELLKEFSEELEFNTDLRAEVTLRKNVNHAIAEKDILSLRNKLKQVKEEADNKEIKSIIPDSGIKMNWWRAGVAVAIIVLAITGVANREYGLFNRNFDSYYTTAEWSPERSVISETDYLQQADFYRLNGEYDKAIETYDQAIRKVNEKYPYQFWKATLLQDMERYEKAIPEYSKVIEHGNNTFIEEAEWYKSYCYIKLEDWDAAKKQLLAIIERKGFYESDAKAILRRLKYTFK